MRVQDNSIDGGVLPNPKAAALQRTVAGAEKRSLLNDCQLFRLLLRVQENSIDGGVLPIPKLQRTEAGADK